MLTLKRDNSQLENNASNSLGKNSRKNGNYFRQTSNFFCQGLLRIRLLAQILKLHLRKTTSKNHQKNAKISQVHSRILLHPPLSRFLNRFLNRFLKQSLSQAIKKALSTKNLMHKLNKWQKKCNNNQTKLFTTKELR